ncbi:histone family protein DNA-binding protein [Solidesulfovibrio carbinoliphilus subsp. oakridgensis]|uniref:Histone family protein DNA-binding protein n=1 Tax=Solidesulfovibrio carbinoliphilus subsp. oakridgensis TaxID=694327 RepID=G7QC90_9BACT|nr:HU family DNA-binding protein [Solidesulfovibrio carbinoliphilus]EHJ49536.1 histone family protein DNA-binding protein [Solidesulfovibrio carbinoliphilus subsp. oakridgensis]
MTQTEFIKRFATESGMTQDAAKNCLALAGQMVEATMRAGESVKFPCLGTFTPVATKERQGRNPRTGEPLTIPAGVRIKFKAAFEVD